MQVLIQTLIIESRLIQVTIIAPEGPEVSNFRELAELALKSANMEIGVEGVKVMVRDVGEV